MNGPNIAEIPPAESLPLPPIEPDHWREILDIMRLSPQQAQILDLLLRGVGDENIAPTVGLRKSTVRADIAHLLAQPADNRTELAMQVLALAHQVKPTRGGPSFAAAAYFRAWQVHV